MFIVQLEIGNAFQDICVNSGIMAISAPVSVVEKCVADPKAFEMILKLVKDQTISSTRPVG